MSVCLGAGWDLTDPYSPAAIEVAPATSPATPPRPYAGLRGTCRAPLRGTRVSALASGALPQGLPGSRAGPFGLEPGKRQAVPLGSEQHRQGSSQDCQVGPEAHAFHVLL